MDYNIRHSTAADLPTLLYLADEARQIMRRSGNMQQWGGGYPSADVFRRDIERGVSYIVEHDGQPVGTFAFIPGPDPTYARIYEGAWTDDDRPYYAVHRIASLPASRGVMASLLRYCFAHTDNVRIDTHRDNTIMRHLLSKHGFSYCGIVYLENGDERLAYQRLSPQDCLSRS
ncbi:MAG: N-acetyltransferase [Prevotella sp.]|nr:N-acetyltransferase [Prevotella sp.]